MYCIFLLANVLASGTQALAPVTIRWGSLHANNLFLAAAPLPNGAAPIPQTLKIWDKHKLEIWDKQGETSPNENPYFVVRSDKTIIWEASGVCVEAIGDEIGVNHCTGKPNQLWDILPSSNGRRNQIQLSGSDRCIDVKRNKGELNGAPVMLRECDRKATESWLFEESAEQPFSVHKQGFATFDAARASPFMFLSMLGALSFSVWLRHRQGAVGTAVVGGSAPLDVSTPAAMAIRANDIMATDIAQRALVAACFAACFAAPVLLSQPAQPSVAEVVSTTTVLPPGPRTTSPLATPPLATPFPASTPTTAKAPEAKPASPPPSEAKKDMAAATAATPVSPPVTEAKKVTAAATAAKPVSPPVAEAKKDMAAATAAKPASPPVAEAMKVTAAATAAKPVSPPVAEAKKVTAAATAAKPVSPSIAEAKKDTAAATAAKPVSPPVAEAKKDTAVATAAKPVSPLVAEAKKDTAAATAAKPVSPPDAEAKRDAAAATAAKPVSPPVAEAMKVKAAATAVSPSIAEAKKDTAAATAINPVSPPVAEGKKDTAAKPVSPNIAEAKKDMAAATAAKPVSPPVAEAKKDTAAATAAKSDSVKVPEGENSAGVFPTSFGLIVASDEKASQLGLRRGVLVLKVTTSAARAGLQGYSDWGKFGDVILEVGTSPVNSNPDLIKALEGYAVGQEVPLTVARLEQDVDGQMTEIEKKIFLKPNVKGAFFQAV